jgi:hypothetical protein
MICKLVFKKQIHLCNNLVDYKGLHLFILSTFSHLPKHFELIYSDEEGDKIMLSSQDDMEVFKLIHANAKKFPKLYIQECAPIHVASACCGPDESFELLT